MAAEKAAPAPAPAPAPIKKAKKVKVAAEEVPVVAEVPKPVRAPKTPKPSKAPKAEPVIPEPVKVVPKERKIIDTPVGDLVPVPPQARAPSRKKLQKARPVNVTKEAQIIEFN